MTFIKIPYYLILLAFISNHVLAEHSEVTGKALGWEGDTIYLYAYSDYITFTEVEISSSIIDSIANFKFIIDNDDVIYSRIKIGNYQSDIYLESGEKYNLEILSSPQKNKDEFSMFEQDVLKYNFKGRGENDLNIAIREFNSMYNEFVSTYFYSILFNRDRKKVNIFRSKVEKRFNEVENKYLDNYILYRFASLEYSTQLIGFKNCVNKYVLNKPVLYNHVEYMEFFNNLFKKYIIKKSRMIKYEDLLATINEHQSYFALLDSLGKDTLLFNEILREFILLSNFSSLYYHPDFKQESLRQILATIEQEDKFIKHRKIATSIKKALTISRNNTKIPSINIYYDNGDSLSLDDYKGKYIYLSFFKSDCDFCLLEFKVQEKLWKKYHDSIVFISISIDKDFDDYEAFIAKNKYLWNFWHFQHNNTLIETFQVYSLPLYVLIDKGGVIVEIPTEKPSENIEQLLYKITNPIVNKIYKMPGR